MSNRTTFRIISLALILALLSVPAIYNADAQDPPRPPEPKRTPQPLLRDGQNGATYDPPGGGESGAGWPFTHKLPVSALGTMSLAGAPA